VEREREAAGADGTWSRRALHASATFGGSVRVDGDLDPVTGEALLTALRAVQDADARTRGRDDERTPAQRRSDALGEICRQWLDHGDRPSVGGERPHLTITVPIEALRTGGAGAELDHAGPIPADMVRQLACDAAVMRVVMSGRSQPLDVGRRTSVIPPGMRRAVIVRDRTCRFPGCERPHTWCDAHHVDHWADGGPTCLGNLLLLCRRHHRMVHRPGGFRLEIVDGAPIFRRPDGTVLEGRAPP
jgi:5-methylcytosine-specific restriction protein A